MSSLGIEKIPVGDLIRGQKGADVHELAGSEYRSTLVFLEKHEVLGPGRQLVGKNVVAALGRFDQRLPKVRMCDLCQFDGALIDALAPKLGDAVFGDDEVDVGPKARQPGTFSQLSYNTGNTSADGSGRQGDDG